MKRDFLANIKIGDQALSKEVIDAIMAENGRDIEAEKAKYSDYETMKTQLEEAQATIANFKKDGQTVEDIQKKATEWENKYNQAIEDGKKAIAERDFNDKLKTAIASKKGKNAKAIAALLDVEALKASKNQDADIESAIDTCQKDNGYLFDMEEKTPSYAKGTGASNQAGKAPVMTLASALKEHYNS